MASNKFLEYCEKVHSMPGDTIINATQFNILVRHFNARFGEELNEFKINIRDALDEFISNTGLHSLYWFYAQVFNAENEKGIKKKYRGEIVNVLQVIALTPELAGQLDAKQLEYKEYRRILFTLHKRINAVYSKLADEKRICLHETINFMTNTCANCGTELRNIFMNDSE